jgi:aspartate aminotransferase/aminotransferase
MSIYINQIVYDLRRRGQDLTALSLGEAFFDIPQFDFGVLDFQKGHHYSDSQGLPELRAAIAAYYGDRYGASIDPDRELMITAGSKAAIFMAMQATLDPGDEILIPEPAWVSYREQAELVGASIKFIPYRCAPVDYVNYVGERTRLLILNNPNNPAGRVLSRGDLEALYRMCQDRGIYLLVDEAYSDFVGDGSFSSLASIAADKEGMIVVNSLSKNLGISGWRVGYVITHPRLLAALVKLNQHIITCAPTILLLYLARYFDQMIEVTQPQIEKVVSKRLRVAQLIRKMGLTCLDGESTFYFFLSIDGFEGSSLDFAMELLLNHGIAVVPGSAYGASTDGFVRLSIGTESEERIEAALAVIRNVIAGKKVDRASLTRKLAEMGLHPFWDRGAAIP